MVVTSGHLLILYIAALCRITASQNRISPVRPEPTVSAVLSGPFIVLFPRMLLAPVDLDPFNDMVTPFEVEAYDILKYRSRAYDQPRAVHQPRRDSSVLFHGSCPAM